MKHATMRTATWVLLGWGALAVIPGRAGAQLLAGAATRAAGERSGAPGPRPGHAACNGCHALTDAEARAYQMYANSTIDMVIDARPGEESLVCLSCHDGSLTTGPLADPSNEAVLGTDLTNDHPVGVLYDPTRDPDFQPVAAGPLGQLEVGGLPLFDGRVECPTCHDPHTGTPGSLRKSNRGSALCLTCHIK